MRSFALALLVPSAAFASDLVGAQSCRTCHAQAYEIWAKSPHAHATDSLTPEQRKSPMCLSCHSRDEQRSNPADPVSGVSCETCHGGGRSYQSVSVMRDKELARLFGLTDAAMTCVACHGAGSPSPQPFNIKAALSRIDHWTKDRAPRTDAARPDRKAHDFPAAWLAGASR
ncbi:MAG TPA: multiheme c-type cytochrome [Myxococcales bacterium]|nr:multiheme c-type cytochrome [Myxococcales bacterium]